MVAAARSLDDYLKLLESVDVYVNTGSVIWSKRGRGRQFGREAGSFNAAGYRRLNHYGLSFYIHRLVYVAAHGELPEYIDHIDRNPANNAISNLRAATQSVNNFNRGPMKNNTSGFPGVFYCRTNRRWVAAIKANGRKVSLGSFRNLEEAITARRRGEHEMGIRQNG